MSMTEWVKCLRNRSVVIVIHRSKTHKSKLVPLMQNFTTLIVREPEDQEPLMPNRLYIAPANYHLQLDENLCWRLRDTPPVWYCKPAIDVVFESLANTLKQKACGILLSGANEDGARGMKHLYQAGAATLCIDSSRAEYSIMPKAAEDQNAVMLSFKQEEIKFLAQTLFNSY